jgi:hypothetical protein
LLAGSNAIPPAVAVLVGTPVVNGIAVDSTPAAEKVALQQTPIKPFPCIAPVIQVEI